MRAECFPLRFILDDTSPLHLLFFVLLTWGMMVILERRSCRPTSAMLMPSIIILPFAASKILKIPKAREDFPAPVRPTIPTYKLFSSVNIEGNVIHVSIKLSSTSFTFCLIVWTLKSCSVGVFTVYVNSQHINICLYIIMHNTIFV